MFNWTGYVVQGHITLKARLMALVGEGCHIFFTIKDTSAGIPQERLMDVFNPCSNLFERKDNAYVPLNLNFWMSKILVEKMGGLISVHSVLGQGNEFRFSLRFDLAGYK